MVAGALRKTIASWNALAPGKGIPLWSFALYRQDQPFSPHQRLGRPVRVFNSRRLRLSGRHPHTRADPFVVAHGEWLTVFYEHMAPKGVGKIAGLRTRDLESFEPLGILLDEPHHLSFPFVFGHAGEMFMMPEARASGEVALYRFTDFPHGLRKLRTLVARPLADPFLLRHDGLWFLFATSSEGLEIHFADDPVTGIFRPHPRNPIVTDRRYCRSGGGPIALPGQLLRVAQDCSVRYGDNIHLIAINTLSPHDYAEELVVADFFERSEPWNRDGAHHLSVTAFGDATVIAADGKHEDRFVNRLFARLRG